MTPRKRVLQFTFRLFVRRRKIEHLKLLINDPKTDLEPEAKSEIENRMKNILNDLVFTKALYNQEKSYSSVTDRFSKKVEESRQTLAVRCQFGERFWGRSIATKFF